MNRSALAQPQSLLRVAAAATSIVATEMAKPRSGSVPNGLAIVKAGGLRISRRQHCRRSRPRGAAGQPRHFQGMHNKLPIVEAIVRRAVLAAAIGSKE
jgi:hypothetical protein